MSHPARTPSADSGDDVPLSARPFSQKNAPLQVPAWFRRTPAEQQEYEKRQQAREERRRERAHWSGLLAAVLPHVPAPLGRAELELIVYALLAGLDGPTYTLFVERYRLEDDQGPTHPEPLEDKLARLDAVGLSRLLVEMALLPAVAYPGPYPTRTRLEQTAIRYGVTAPGQPAPSTGDEQE